MGCTVAVFETADIIIELADTEALTLIYCTVLSISNRKGIESKPSRNVRSATARTVYQQQMFVNNPIRHWVTKMNGWCSYM